MENVKDLNYYKHNCEEDYIGTPISVLRYIIELEQALQLLQTDVSGQSEQFYCYNVKSSEGTHKCIKQCEICKPKNI